MRDYSDGSRRRMTLLTCAALLVLALSALAGDVPARSAAELSPQARLAKQVRHELVMLPFYSVFDSLEFAIDGSDTVVLSGQVVRPTLKSSAENVLRRVEGVGKVVNNIEVLPLSPFDDRLRLATYYAIYSRPGLDRYALQAIPPIHIIVKNGNITLIGVVGSEFDKNVAGIVARGVPLAFSVENHLQVERRS